MKFVDKITGLFRKKKEPEIKREINIKNINEWLTEEKSETEKLFKEKIEILYSELLPALKKLEEDIEQLAKHDLTKNKAEKKLIQMTELGRKEYINAINKLIENIRKKEEYEVDYIKNKINEFAEYSAKSDFKTTILIGKEIECIRNDIKKIISLENDFKNENMRLLKKRDLVKVISQKNNEKEIKTKTNDKINEQIEEAEKSFKDYEKKLDEAGNNLLKIKESQEYKKRESLTSELQKKEESLKEIESKINALIDKKILEKYAYKEQDEASKTFALEYSKDSIKTLLLEDAVQISNMLEDIKDKIRNNLIKIKDPEKAVQKLSIETKTLLNYKDDLIKIREEIKNINTNISNIKINLPEILNERRSIEDKILEYKETIGSLTKKKDKIDKTILELEAELAYAINQW